MDYLLKINILIVAFFLFYILLLRPTTFFRSNRWFLITGLILSVILPFVVLTNYQYYEPLDLQNYTIQYFEAPQVIEQKQDTSFNFAPYLFGIYAIGVIVLVIKSTISLLSVVKFISQSKQDARHIIYTTKTNAAFSFFNFILVNPKNFTQEELKLVLNHEQIHVKQWHSLDIVVAHLFAILLWFNPFVWLYKKAIQENLEYITDNEVIKQSGSGKTYQKLLLKTSLPDLQPIFSNTFYKSSIKNRIVMLNKKKSHQLLQLKYALLIPAVAFFLTSMNTKTVYVPIENNTTSEVNSFQKDIRIIFDKTLTDEQLKTIKTNLENDGVTMIINKITRNGNNEISEIDIDFKTANGTASYTITEPDGIEPFYFEMSAKNGGFGVGLVRQQNLTDAELSEIDSQIEEQFNSFLNQFNGNLDELLKFYKKSSKAELMQELIETNKKIRLTKKNPNISINYNLSDSLHYKYVIEKSTQVFRDNDSITRINASNINNNPMTKSQNITFYINDKPANDEDLSNLDPEDIDSVTVIKDKKELKKLNQEDQDGVIKIVLKSQRKYSVTPGKATKIEKKPDYETDPTKSFLFYKEMMKSKLLSNAPVNELNTSFSDIKLNYYLTKYDTITINKDGSRIRPTDFDKIKPDEIRSIEVIKDPKKLSNLGYSNNREIIIVETQPLSNHLLQNQKNSITYYRVDSAQYTDDIDASKNAITQYLYKETTNQDLQDQIKKLKEFGVTMSYSKLKRNKNGHITNIKVKLQNDDGQEIEDTFSEKDGAVVMEYGLSNGKLKIAKLTD